MFVFVFQYSFSTYMYLYLKNLKTCIYISKNIWTQLCYPDTPGGGHKKIKGPTHILKVAITLEKPPTPTHI